MKSVFLFIFFALISCPAYTQDSLFNSVCNELTSKYTNTLNREEKINLYYKTISSATKDLSDSLRKEFISQLDSNCLVVKKLKQQSTGLTIVSEEDLLNSLLKRKSDKAWSEDELKHETERLKSHSNESKEFRSKVMFKLSQHMNYSDFKSLTEFQQGKTIRRLANHLKK